MEHLLAWGHPVYPVNPKVAARAREGYRAAPVKSDALDAFALADLLRRQITAWRPLRRPSTTLAGLQALVRDRERFVDRAPPAPAPAARGLLTYYPALPQLFSSLDRAITLAFLRRFPTPHDAERLTVARLARFLHREGYSGRTHPGVLLARLRAHPMTPSDGTETARARTALTLGDLLDGSRHPRRLRRGHRCPRHPAPRRRGLRDLPRGRRRDRRDPDRRDRGGDRFPTPGSLLA